MKGKLIKTEEAWTVWHWDDVTQGYDSLPLYQETFDPNTKLPIIPLEDGKQVEFEIINVYVSPPDSIHCNRGAFADHARLIKEYPELEGTMKLCEEIIQKRTGKMTEEEWQAAERAQTSTKTETTADYIDRHIIQSMLEFAREINDVSDEVILQTAQEKSDMFVKWHEHSTEFGHLAYVRGFVDAIEWYRDKLKKPKNEIND